MREYHDHPLTTCDAPRERNDCLPQDVTAPEIEAGNAEDTTQLPEAAVADAAVDKNVDRLADNTIRPTSDSFDESSSTHSSDLVTDSAEYNHTPAPQTHYMTKFSRNATFAKAIVPGLLGGARNQKRPRLSDTSNSTSGSKRAKINHNSTRGLARASYQTWEPIDLDGRTTVIVGAGIIGMMIAYELMRTAGTGPARHKIIVVELHAKECNKASENNPGLLSYKDLPRALHTLGRYSKNAWDNLARDRQFVRGSAYSADSVFTVKPGAKGPGTGAAYTPSWFKRPYGWSMVPEGGEDGSAMVDPSRLGDWLRSQCGASVEFLWGHRVSQVIQGVESDILSITIENCETQTSRTIRCDNLILTAGPWTVGLLEMLFPDLTIKLPQQVQSRNWCLAKYPPNEHVTAVALRVENSTTSRYVDLRGHEDRATVFIADRSTDRAVLEGPCEREGGTLLAPYQLGKEIGPKHLKMKIGLQTAINRSGRSFISVSKDGLPVIAKVPASALGLRRGWINKTRYDTRHFGVWVCFGHGGHGLTLASGSAKIMTTMILGAQPEIDCSPFALPGYGRSRQVRRGDRRQPKSKVSSSVEVARRASLVVSSDHDEVEEDEESWESSEEDSDDDYEDKDATYVDI
ncbi:hypothetical protein LTR50_003029 [Elasticomyces elasticus]|nr:hypothetical protein LTR50_003029 [Elasticomyces elasticus]